MANNTRNVVIKLEDLPESTQELTPEIARLVRGGGACIEVPTQTGTLDQVAKVSKVDYVGDYQCDMSYGVNIRPNNCSGSTVSVTAPHATALFR